MRKLTVVFASVMLVTACFAQGRGGSRGGHGGHAGGGGGFRGGHVAGGRSFSGGGFVSRGSGGRSFSRGFAGSSRGGFVGTYARGGRGFGGYRGGWHGGGRYVSVGFGWYDPYWAVPAYYDYGYYGCPYDPYFYGPCGYDPYAYYPGPVYGGGVVIGYQGARRAYVARPVPRVYAPARVVAIDGQWHHFGRR